MIDQYQFSTLHLFVASFDGVFLLKPNRQLNKYQDLILKWKSKAIYLNNPFQMVYLSVVN